MVAEGEEGAEKGAVNGVEPGGVEDTGLEPKDVSVGDDADAVVDVEDLIRAAQQEVPEQVGGEDEDAF